MRKLITALGTNELNQKLKKSSEFNVIGNDIPYQEGVLDVLRGNSDIEVLILSEILVGDYDIKEFLNIILKINPYLEIIFFMEKEDIAFKTFLQNLGIYKIFVDNENSLDNIISMISIKNKEERLSNEIKYLKKIIENNNLENSKKVKIKENFKSKINNKVIAISGYYGSGKTIITSLLGRTAKNLGINTLIIDFDILNNSINTLFKINKKNNNSSNSLVEENIIKINSKLDILCAINLFDENQKINYEIVKNMIEELKKKYDLIIIDTSSETNLKYVKTILINVDKIIFIVIPDILELKKSQKLLETYINDWQISIHKFKLLLNKVNIASIDDSVIKNFFVNLTIIDKIYSSVRYTSLCNNLKINNVSLKKYKNVLEKIVN